MFRQDGPVHKGTRGLGIDAPRILAYPPRMSSEPSLRSDRLARYVELVDNPEFIVLLCHRIAEGETLREITLSLDVPYSRIIYWLMDDDGRYKLYKRSLEAQALGEVDETLKIADSAEGEISPVAVSAAKLRIETRFKRAKHHAPKEYGDVEKEGAGGPVRVILVDFRKESEAGRVIDVSPNRSRVAVSAARNREEEL